MDNKKLEKITTKKKKQKFKKNCMKKMYLLLTLIIFVTLNTNYIIQACILIPPEADFSATNTLGPAPLVVNFTNMSTNTGSSLWEFGDGDSSTETNPIHEYTEGGSYDVSLFVEVNRDFGDDDPFECAGAPCEGSCTDSVTKLNFVTVTTDPTPTPTPIDDDKSFSFKCNESSKIGAAGIETLTMDLNETETCLLKLTNLESGVPIEIGTLSRSGLRSATSIDPAIGIPDANGELVVTITAISKGTDWVAWAVPNDKGEFEFSKKAYDSGIAWGMFVEVK